MKVMRDRDRKLTRAVICVLLSGMLLTACGQTDVTNAETTTIEIDKKGSIVNTIVEDFSKDYYDLSEMKDQISEEVDAYNSEQGEDLVTLQDAVKKSSNVRVTLTFKSVDAYADFNSVTLFMGTVSEAGKAGYTIPDTLVNSDGEKVAPDKLADDQKVIILSEKLTVDAPGAIAYAPAKAVISGKSVDLSKVTDDLSYIVLKAN